MLKDCTEALSQEDYRSGMEYIEKYYGARAIGISDIKEELQC
jgi:hypothetical protein